jgi:hypothetical protein
MGGSDLRWKKDIIPLKGALEIIGKLKGVSYSWRSDEFPKKDFADWPTIGLIAQDTEKVLPEVVTTDEQGFKSIRYDMLAPVLIEAVKQLKADNEALRAEINALKRVDLLEKRKTYA